MAKRTKGETPKGRGKRPAKRSRANRKQEHRWTSKEKSFVQNYLLCFNGAKAARDAGYSQKNARQSAHENLTKPYIRAEVDRRFGELHMSSTEVLARLADQARGSLRPFTNVNADGSIYFDFSGPEAAEQLQLLRKVTTKRTRRVVGRGEDAEEWEDEYVTVELHDQVKALELIGKALKLFVERQEHTGPDGGPIQIFDMNEWKRERGRRLKAVAALQE